jgi:hypothetical protein
MTQGQLLAETMAGTRDLVYFYLNKIEPEYWNRSLEINGKKMNTVSWLAAHLAWAENMLILQGCADKNLGKPWFEHFAIRKEAPPVELYPSPDELRAAMKEVHEASMEVVAALSDEQLLEPNNHDMAFKRGNTKMHIIIHHIRHEGTHAGQLSLLCKGLDVATI